MTEEIKQGMTRREVLKKGAMLGGTLMWAIPVVQAVGMSPAMASIPSETSCCLRVMSVIAVDADAPFYDGDDVWVTTTFQNCSTHNTDYDVGGKLERLPSTDGGVPTGAPVQLSTGTGDLAYTIGQLEYPGDQSNPIFKDGNIVSGQGMSPGWYVYRVKGQFRCPDSSSSIQPHTTPSAEWVYSNPIEVSAP